MHSKNVRQGPGQGKASASAFADFLQCHLDATPTRYPLLSHRLFFISPPQALTHTNDPLCASQLECLHPNKQQHEQAYSNHRWLLLPGISCRRAHCAVNPSASWHSCRSTAAIALRDEWPSHCAEVVGCRMWQQGRCPPPLPLHVLQRPHLATRAGPDRPPCPWTSQDNSLATCK